MFSVDGQRSKNARNHFFPNIDLLLLKDFIFSHFPGGFVIECPTFFFYPQRFHPSIRPPITCNVFGRGCHNNTQITVVTHSTRHNHCLPNVLAHWQVIWVGQEEATLSYLAGAVPVPAALRQ